MKVVSGKSHYHSHPSGSYSGSMNVVSFPGSKDLNTWNTLSKETRTLASSIISSAIQQQRRMRVRLGAAAFPSGKVAGLTGVARGTSFSERMLALEEQQKKTVTVISTIADGLHGLPKKLTAEAAPVAVPFADPDKFSHYVGLSAARARKLHRTEGFPLRARGKGARRSYYAVLSEVEAWWKKQNGE